MGKKGFFQSSSARKCYSGCIFFTVVLLFIVGLLAVFYAESMVNTIINQELVFSERSETFASYREPPIEIKTKVYFFNLTNNETFVSGLEKPNLTEVGPYVIAERWERRNVIFNENGTVSSQLHRVLRFSREDSVGPDSDTIVTINVPYISAVAQASSQSSKEVSVIATLLEVFQLGPTEARTVRELMFGYTSALLKVANANSEPGQSLPHTDFGFFIGKNNSLDPTLLVNTGASNWKQTGLIERFDGSPYLSFWSSNSCNRINGSDGSLFPPGLTPASDVYLFAQDMCRSLLLQYERTVLHSHVQTLRFTPPADIFAPPSDRPENVCFCVDQKQCAPRGLFNISQCKFGSPTYISFPHFYLADPALLEDVQGLAPNQRKHQFYIDIAPRLGISMKAKIRMQINFLLKSHPAISSSVNLPSIYFPVFWMEAGVDQLPRQVVELVQQAMTAPGLARTWLPAVMFTLALLLLLATGGALLWRRRRRRARGDRAAPTVAVSPGKNGASGGATGKSVELTPLTAAYVPYSDSTSTAI